MAERFIELTEFEGKSRKSAEATVMKENPSVGARALREIIESNKWLARARTRCFAARMQRRGIERGAIVLRANSKKSNPKK
jgi:hypothetical protein